MQLKTISARLVLKERVPPKPIYQKEGDIYNRLELKQYCPSCLSVEETNTICTHIEFNTGVDPKFSLSTLNWSGRHYKKEIKSRYVFKRLENTLRMLVELAKNKIPVDFEFAEEVCSYWNNQVSNMTTKELSKIKIGSEFKGFVNCAVAITYILNFKLGNSKERFRKIVDILLDAKLPSFEYSKSNIYDILAGRVVFNKKFDHLFTANNSYQFNEQYFYKGSKHEDLFNTKFKNLFINVFFQHNPTKGKMLFTLHRIKLSKWFDQISAEFISKKPFRNTCGLKLVGKNTNIGPLLEEYFLYLTTQKSTVLALDLIKEGWWSSFVDHVRYTYGYSDFWKLVNKRS